MAGPDQAQEIEFGSCSNTVRMVSPIVLFIPLSDQAVFPNSYELPTIA